MRLQSGSWIRLLGSCDKCHFGWRQKENKKRMISALTVYFYTHTDLFTISEPQNSSIHVFGLHNTRQSPDFAALKQGKSQCRVA